MIAEVFLNITFSDDYSLDLKKLQYINKGICKDLLSSSIVSSTPKIEDEKPSDNNKSALKKLKVIDLLDTSIYKSFVKFDFKKNKKFMLFGYDDNNEIIFRRLIKSSDEYKTIIQTESDSKQLTLYVDKSINCELLDFRLEFLQKLTNYNTTDTTINSITAAMATYPARENIVEDTLNSIIGQVDKLFIYLNNYDNVPEYISNHPYKEKIEFILNPKSTLRAAGKFSWLGQVNGYHFTIDDDIIYPKDYVKKMISFSKSKKDDALIGVHGSIFNTVVKDASKCRKSIFNFQKKLMKSKIVHMVGSGTTLFPHKVAKTINRDKLLSHAIANDELLAIEAKDNDITVYAINREDNWLKGNEFMEYGVFEEKQLNKNLKIEVNNIVKSQNPWIIPVSE